MATLNIRNMQDSNKQAELLNTIKDDQLDEQGQQKFITMFNKMKGIESKAHRTTNISA